MVNIQKYNEQGQLHGQVILYNNDELSELIMYQNGLMHGPYHKYHQNQLIILANYLNNQLNGIYYCFDEQGLPLLSITYQNDNKHGIETIFQKGLILGYRLYENNKITQETLYKTP